MIYALGPLYHREIMNHASEKGKREKVFNVRKGKTESKRNNKNTKFSYAFFLVIFQDIK